MKLHRIGLVAGLSAGSLLLAACGSDSPSTPAAGSGSGSGTSSSGGGSADCFDGTLNAAGSSAQKPAINAWTQAYQAKCSGASINYNGQGSGTGRTSFVKKQVPVAGSDSALKDPQKGQADARCAPGTAVDLPMVITPEAVIFNVSGVDKLTLTPSVAAQVFDGKIKNWNDPAIAKANPGAKLPDKTITAVHRSTDSGTTENFTKFLHAQAPTDWTYPGAQAWPNNTGQGASDSAGMVSQVKSTDGAVGYVDNPDALKNSLKTASFDTGSGAVGITKESVEKAISKAKVSNTNGDIKLSIDYGLKDAGAYPAILTTYEITCTQGLAADQAKAVKSFLTYTSSAEGQGELSKVGHFPLPESIRSTVAAQVAKLGAGS